MIAGAPKVSELNKDQLITLINSLNEQNASLIMALHGSNVANASLQSERAHFVAELAKLHEVQYNDYLKKVVVELQTENALLREEKVQLMARLSAVEERLATVEARDKSVSVREAMRMLERHICYVAAGSNNKFKTFYCLAKITSEDTDVYGRLQDELKRLGLEKDHLVELSYLKDVGDFATHHQRPQMTYEDWKNEIEQSCMSSEIDEAELDELQNRMKLLDALWSYHTPDVDSGTVELRDPIVVPKVPKKKC